jgi:antitoxin (DNA-binding transcriptional repressor) of toxin-antitoxin stability system
MWDTTSLPGPDNSVQVQSTEAKRRSGGHLIEIDEFEAMNGLKALLDRVEVRKVIIITRHGKPIARLMPETGELGRLQAAAAIQRISTRAREIKSRAPDWHALKGDRNPDSAVSLVLDN